MTDTEIRAEKRASNRPLFGIALGSIATTVTGYKAWRRAAARRRAVAGKTPDQLKDVGLEAPRSALDDKATILITNLMSMR